MRAQKKIGEGYWQETYSLGENSEVVCKIEYPLHTQSTDELLEIIENHREDISSLKTYFSEYKHVTIPDTLFLYAIAREPASQQ